MDFIYERKRLPTGVKIETVTGGGRYSGRVWLEIARQIYCENGKDGFRDIGHFQSGAPFLYDADERISISHTEGCLVVATIKTPQDADLRDFSKETALGVDVERADREKVLKLRDRFLTEEERRLVAADSVEDNVTAWTAKESMLKAGMDPAINWHSDIIITELPSPEGKGYIILEGRRIELSLYTVKEGGFIITVAKFANSD